MRPHGAPAARARPRSSAGDLSARPRDADTPAGARVSEANLRGASVTSHQLTREQTQTPSVSLRDCLRVVNA